MHVQNKYFQNAFLELSLVFSLENTKEVLYKRNQFQRFSVLYQSSASIFTCIPHLVSGAAWANGKLTDALLCEFLCDAKVGAKRTL